MNTYGIINDSEQLRNVTGSWWANADFSRIERIVRSVESELAAVVGNETMQWIATGDGRSSEAWTHAACAVGYMACMRYYRLNDISHQDGGRKVKIDRDNEARPFEWQLARDDRAHLEEYYRALDRLLYALQGVETFRASKVCQQMQQLIIPDADTLSTLTGLDPSPWLYVRLVPFLLESQHFVEKAYGQSLASSGSSYSEASQGPSAPAGSTVGCAAALPQPILEAAQRATVLGALALMGRRMSLQQLPYGLMQLVVSNGGGNQELQPTLDQLTNYLRHLSHDQHYWLNEMRTLRDEAAAASSTVGSAAVGRAAASPQPTYLQVPANDPNNKCFRL